MHPGQLKYKFIAFIIICAVSHEAHGQKINYVHRTNYHNYNSCAVDSLYVCLQVQGSLKQRLREIDEEMPAGPLGNSFGQILDYCLRHDVHARLEKMDEIDLYKLSGPTIFHVNDNHFIAIFPNQNGRILAFDNRVGLFECDNSIFARQYTSQGHVLVFGRSFKSFLSSSYVRIAALFTLLLSLSIIIMNFFRNRRGMKMPEGRNAIDKNVSSRQGKTLAELIVVIVIIIVLFSLLLPAVQKIRSAASHTQCLSNLRNLGIATHNYHDIFAHLPPSGGTGPREKLTSKGGGEFVPTTQMLFPPTQTSTAYWRAGRPDSTSREQPGSWVYSLLPSLEQNHVFRSRSWQTPISTLICPSRRSSTALAARNDDFGNYEGGGWNWAKCDFAANRKIIFGHPYVQSLGYITKGTSNTFLLGEKAMRPDLYNSGSWFYDEPYFLGNTFGSVRSGSLVFRDANDTRFIDNWGSAHPSSASFLMGDGSCRSIRYDIPRNVFATLLMPR